MIKYVPEDTSIVFSEIPDEIAMALNISQCASSCPGCHSPYLREDIGDELTDEVLIELIKKNPGVTCVCFMGGDNDIDRLCELARRSPIRTAWYTGSKEEEIDFYKVGWFFDYIKVGPYIESFGPINNPNTNQRLYEIGRFINQDQILRHDITNKFWKHGSNQ